MCRVAATDAQPAVDGPYPADWRDDLVATFWRDPVEATGLVDELERDREDWLLGEWRSWGHAAYGVDEDAPIAHYFHEDVDPEGVWAEPRRLLERLAAANAHHARALVDFVEHRGNAVDWLEWGWLVRRSRHGARRTGPIGSIRRHVAARPRERRDSGSHAGARGSPDGESDDPEPGLDPGADVGHRAGPPARLLELEGPAA